MTRLREIEATQVKLANSLCQQAEYSIEVADTAVLSLVALLETAGTSPEALARVNSSLPALISGKPPYRSIVVIDPEGNKLASTLHEIAAVSVADRDYFRRLRDDPTLGLFISPPFRRRTDSTWVVAVSRRFHSPAGGFGGVVMATVDLSYFVSYYATLGLASGSSVTLATRNGQILARFPGSLVQIGRMAPGELFQHLVLKGSGSYQTQSLIDGVSRIVGYWRGDRYPLVVAVGVSSDQALASWRANAIIHITIATILASGISLLGLYLIRQVHRSLVAEANLRDSEARYREQTEVLLLANERATLAMDAGGIGIWDWNVTENQTLWTPSMYRIYGKMPQGDLNSYQTWREQLHPDDAEAVGQALQDAIQGIKPFDKEFRIFWDDGSLHYIRSSGRVTHDASGRALRMVGVDVDVSVAKLLTDERDRKAALLASNEAKSRFLAVMSHELRTPLNGIIGFAHLVAREGGITARQKERVEAILRAGRHLLEMITCVLEVSAVESDQISMAPIKVDVLAIANACLELMRPAAQAKHISLDIVVAQKIPTYLLVDPTRLRQVLVSLLSNAVKFTDNGSVALRVHVVPGATALRIEVADTGTGIPIEHQERLFRNFERGAGSVTTEGAGLGLALSARFVALMGGKIGHQDNPGGGSVFWLEFPLDTKLADSAESNGVGTPHVSAGPLHILVVDDTAMNLEITSEILRTEGHRVTCVAGGAAAVAAVAATPFDVVLMDVRMPEIDGLEATRQIRAQQGGGRRVPIVGLSAQALADQVAACLDAGMDDYLAKPFDPDTLLKTVARAAIANVYPGMA